jgi:multiple sugar transport system substrate-binding protein
LFEDPANREAFKAAYGYDLAAPKTWKEFADISQFITDKLAPNVYGSAMIHAADNHFFISERFRNYGGKFFDAETMKATINSPEGVQALTDIVALIKTMPPGAETWGFAECLSALLSGQIAMTVSWPPVARWAQGIDASEEALSWVPKTQVIDKIGYAMPPGGHPQLASGFLLSVSADSKNKDAAFLFVQWLTSKQESLKNVMRPFGLRDPYRLSHYESAEYQALWPTAKEYLATLRDGAAHGLADLSIRSTFKYQDSLARAVIAAIGGVPPQQAFDDLAKQWDEITEQVGLDKQKEAYRVWAAKPSAYPQ